MFATLGLPPNDPKSVVKGPYTVVASGVSACCTPVTLGKPLSISDASTNKVVCGPMDITFPNSTSPGFELVATATNGTSGFVADYSFNPNSSTLFMDITRLVPSGGRFWLSFGPYYGAQALKNGFGTSDCVVTGSTSASSSATSQTQSGASTSAHKSSPSTGLTAGVAAAGAVILLAAILAGVFVLRRRRNQPLTPEFSSPELAQEKTGDLVMWRTRDDGDGVAYSTLPVATTLAEVNNVQAGHS
ncbi:hypothetical protein T439DRAFT_379967 [Meredithblackwellia eburnea MCA 4105]